MANFFKGMLRANAALYGDLEGPMTGLKRGKLTIAIEKGQCIAWIVGKDDLVLSKNNVKDVSFLSGPHRVTDLGSGGGKPYLVNSYKIEMKTGEVGELRLITSTESKVLMLLK